MTPAFFGDIKQHFGRHLSTEEAGTVLRAMNRVLDAGGLRQEIPDHVEAVDKLRELAEDD
ncbi:MAG TPA: hypothetical protein VGN81_19745 [Pseudonocardiaceae bacterium]